MTATLIIVAPVGLILLGKDVERRSPSGLHSGAVPRRARQHLLLAIGVLILAILSLI